MNNTIGLLLDGGLIIKSNDLNFGFIQAESIPFHGDTGDMITTMWTIRIDDSSRVTAIARRLVQKQNASGTIIGSSEEYGNDDVRKDWIWYWTVRYGLEELCGNNVVFIEKEMSR